MVRIKRINCRAARWPVLITALVFSTGCGARRADVTGTVTWHGTLLTRGTVMIEGPDGITRAGSIERDGSYKISDLAAGRVKIGVVCKDSAAKSSAIPRGRGGEKFSGSPLSPSATGPTIPFPESYAEPTKSGVIAVLKAGQNKHDITLP